MDPKEYVEFLLSLGQPTETARLEMRLFLRGTCDRWYTLKLKDGRPLIGGDISNGKEFFRQAAEYLQPSHEPTDGGPGPIPPGQSSPDARRRQ
jgi:hypothetical protein